MSETKLEYYSGEAHTFTSQGIDDYFVFRVPHGVIGAAPYAPANALDHINQIPGKRGTSKPTIAGGRIIQDFGVYEHDEFISFTQDVTQDEMEDLIAAYKKQTIWTLYDYFGDDILVSFDIQDGLQKVRKIKANDMWVLKFKFRKETA